ncbi:MAG: hypothetical protein WKH68_13090, partial [Candidatus Limnocylindria bacterium]
MPLADWPSRDPDCAVCRALVGPAPKRIPYIPPRRVGDVRRADRIRGVLLGALLGDAIGQLHERGLRADWNQIRPGTLRAGGAGQLTVFTAEGLLRMAVRADIKGIGPAYGVMRHAYDGWMFTQGKVPDKVKQHWAAGSSSWPIGWLVRRHELHRVVDGFSGTIAALKTLDLDIALDGREFMH